MRPEGRLILQSLFLWLLSSCTGRSLKDDPEENLNLRPLIGILSQPTHPEPANQSYIAASYVKFVEASGGRAVPILYDSSLEEIQKSFKFLNGVLIPGGSANLNHNYDFFKSAAKLLSLTLEANQAGDFFPLHGTCLGMEVLSLIASKPYNKSLLTHFDSWNNPSALTLTDAAEKSRFFSAMPKSVLKDLQEEALTMENHHYGISLETFAANAGLREFFSVTSLSADRQGKWYISSMESPKYPITVTQWHPEKNSFEWAAGLRIPHSPHAIRVTQAVSNFLVNEARHNHHSVGGRKREIEEVIETDPVRFTGKASEEDQGFDQCYFFPAKKRAASPQGANVEFKVELNY